MQPTHLGLPVAERSPDCSSVGSRRSFGFVSPDCHTVKQALSIATLIMTIRIVTTRTTTTATTVMIMNMMTVMVVITMMIMIKMMIEEKEEE